MRRVGVLLLWSIAASSCATLQAPLTPPAEGGAAWLELTSPHFVLHTDVDGATARARIEDYEAWYAELSDLAFRSPSPPAGKIEVVLFARSVDFHEFTQAQWVGGYATRVDIDMRPRLVVPASALDTRRVFLHELTHRFVSYFMPTAPVWLNEGMATFYETLRVDEESALIGESPYRFDRGIIATHGRIEIGNLPSASALLAMKPTEFHADGGLRNYAGAWFLVSMLATGSESERFWSYVRALTQGASSDEAWPVSFHDVDVDGKFEAYKRAGKVGLVRVTYNALKLAGTASQARAMRDDEVRVMWTTLGLKDPRAPGWAKRATDEAPTSPEAHYWAGQVDEAHGDRAAAQDEYVKALALAPAEPRYVLQVTEGHLFAELKKPRRDRDLGSLAPEMESLARFETSAIAQAFVARYYQDAGDLARATSLASHAVELEPACVECLDRLARIKAKSGDLPAAIVLERRALSVFSHAAEPPKSFVDRLARFERAAAAIRDGSAASASNVDDE